MAASLAKLVGSELNVIDKNTETHSNAGPALKIDPKAFLGRAPQSYKRPNSNVVKHQGMMFHAGVDEALVQSLHPDPPKSQVPMSALPQVAAPAQTLPHIVESTPRSQVVIAAAPLNQTEFYQSIEKVLKSIDKTLKSIDKNYKAHIEKSKTTNQD